MRCKKTRDIPGLLVTACDDLAAKSKAIAQGCRDYLMKPVDARELKTRVNRYLAA